MKIIIAQSYLQKNADKDFYVFVGNEKKEHFKVNLEKDIVENSEFESPVDLSDDGWSSIIELDLNKIK